MNLANLSLVLTPIGKPVTGIPLYKFLAYI